MSKIRDSEPHTLNIKTNLGNVIKLQLHILDDGNFELIINDEGYILGKDEFEKICAYMTRMTSKTMK